MSNGSLELGGDNWAAKDGNLLGYAVGDSSGKYVPREFTFARGSNLAATRVAANGLIEKGRENLLTQSNNFSDSDWTDQLDGSIVSGQSCYDGTRTHALTHSRTHARTHSRTHALTRSSTYALDHAGTQAPTHSPTHSPIHQAIHC